MLASGLSAIALTSRLPLKDHVVPMDQLGTAKIAENIRDFTALAADDGLRLLMVVSGEPAAELGALPVSNHYRTAAPLSTMKAPLGSSVPAIQRLRAVTGSERARNQVPVPFLASACSGFSTL